MVLGAERDEQIEDLADDPVRVGVGAVAFIHHHHGAQARLERLAEHEPGLRHGPLVGVHDQQAPVGHAQHALDLAPEIGVPGRVDDVDPVRVAVEVS